MWDPYPKQPARLQYTVHFQNRRLQIRHMLQEMKHRNAIHRPRLERPGQVEQIDTEMRISRVQVNNLPARQLLVTSAHVQPQLCRRRGAAVGNSFGLHCVYRTLTRVFVSGCEKVCATQPSGKKKDLRSALFGYGVLRAL